MLNFKKSWSDTSKVAPPPRTFLLCSAAARGQCGSPTLTCFCHLDIQNMKNHETSQQITIRSDILQRHNAHHCGVSSIAILVLC